MAKIYIVTEFGFLSDWINASIKNNHALLERHGIDIAPFDSENSDYVPLHHAYFVAEDQKYKIKYDIQKKLTFLKNCIAKNRNILFLCRTANIKRQEQFFNFIQTKLPVSTNDIISIIVLHKPSLIMEAWSLGTFRNDATKSDIYLKYACNLSKLVMANQKQWGQDNVHLIPSLLNSRSSNGVAAVMQQIFALLGINEAPIISAPLAYYGFTNTATAKRLIEARQVHQNDWPKLDNTAYMLALQQAEQKWRPDPLSSLHHRQALLQQGQEDHKTLETMLGLPSHALDAPDWYGELPALDEATSLKPERLHDFAEKLPPEVRHTLLQRFANDHDFLSADQLALEQVLKEHFTTIAEPKEYPKLTVLTTTYNHEKYIGRCIEGVLQQKTDFPIQHLLVDDYSSDGTAAIIRQYAQAYPSIRPVLLHNYHRCIPSSVKELFSRCKSEYAALCDGDDFFTDPLKLQKQVDFLETHRECALCFHPVDVMYEDGSPSRVYPPEEMLPNGVRTIYPIQALLQGNMIQTCSVVYRWRFREGLPDWFDDSLVPGDWYWHLLHAETGFIGYLRDRMGVYWRHPKSLYATAEGNHVDHRKIHGLKEIRTYKAFNDHFKGKYFNDFSKLANGVFADFLQAYMTSGDDALLQEAISIAPEFGKHFFDSLKFVSPKTGTSDKVE